MRALLALLLVLFALLAPAAVVRADAPPPWPPPTPKVELDTKARSAEGLLYLKLGERVLAEDAATAAVPLLRRATKLLPNMPHTHAALGAALAREGRKLDEARTELLRSLELFSKNPWAHSQLGYLCDLQGKREKALLHYRAAVRLDPTSTEYQERLGLSAADNNLPKEALQAFEEVVARDWKSTVAVSNLAELYEQAGAPHKAEAMLLRLVDFAPTQWPLWDRLARFYDRQKRPADAEKARAEIRKLNPPAPVVRNDYRMLRTAKPKAKAPLPPPLPPPTPPPVSTPEKLVSEPPAPEELMSKPPSTPTSTPK